jgi:hypothetical protein
MLDDHAPGAGLDCRGGKLAAVAALATEAEEEISRPRIA